MKKVISLVLAVLMVAAMLCACAAPDAGTTPTTTQKPAPTDPKPTDPIDPAGPVAINVHDFLNDRANWTFHDDDTANELLTIEGGKMHFDCNFPGDLVAAMLNQTVLDGSYKFTLTVNAQPEDPNADDTYWETELFIIARASVAGTTWSEGNQTGYCISSWGDLSTFCLGRAGSDDAFGTEFTWNINDGQPHEIEIATKNIEKDGKTAVEVTVYVDGEVAATAIDEGQNGREGRPTMYPEAGKLVIRAKYMEITVG